MYLVPEYANPWCHERPPGLILVENFITELEEETLLKRVNDDVTASETPIGKYQRFENFKLTTSKTMSPKFCSATMRDVLFCYVFLGSMKHRQVYHYGYEFKYDTNDVDATQPLEKQIPDECNDFWPRLKSMMPSLSFQIPDQITVNKYEPGQGIPPHCDTHSAFCDPIFSLSLANSTVMEFRRPSDGHQISIWLPRRSLLIMSKESRYGWTHGITPRKTDVIPVNDGNCAGLTVVERELRVSFTFRR